MRAEALRLTIARYRLFIAALGLGLVVRLMLAPLGWHGYDMFTFADWAWQLLEEPRSQFYAAPLEVPGDHLPGDLTIMWVIAHLTHLVAPDLDFFKPPYVMILKLVPILCDLLLAIGILRIASLVTNQRRAILIGALAALNPLSIMVSAVWGQWDSVSMMLVVWAILLVLRRRVAWALPLLAYACLLKPQLGLLIPLFAIADVRMPLPVSSGRRALWDCLRGWIASGIASVALVLGACLPFGVGLPGMATRYTIPERIGYALDRYDGTSLGAWNLWYLVFPDIRWDGELSPLGVSYHGIGFALLAMGVVVALAGAIRIEPWPVALAWGSVLAMMATFMLPTRAHERYLFPAVILALMLWALVPGLAWFLAGIMTTSFVNVYLAYSAYKPAMDPGFLQHEIVLRTVATVNVALFVALTAWGVRRMIGEGYVASLTQRVSPPSALAEPPGEPSSP